MINWLAVFLGGGCGSLCRFAISLWLTNPSHKFPFPTLIANILSCIILALTFYLVPDTIQIPNSVKSFIVIGFCGGFSTFSTFSRETFLLMQQGQWGYAFTYIFISVLSCVALIAFIENNKL